MPDMPITASALKKMRVDRRRTRVNAPVIAAAKNAIRKARMEKTQESFSKLYSALDRAVAHRLMSRNKAGRLKSRIVSVPKK